MFYRKDTGTHVYFRAQLLWSFQNRYQNWMQFLYRQVEEEWQLASLQQQNLLNQISKVLPNFVTSLCQSLFHINKITFVSSVTIVVLVVYPLEHSSATLNSPEDSSVTAPTLGKLSSSLPVQYAFIFARNCQLLLYMQRYWYSVNDCKNEFMINLNET